MSDSGEVKTLNEWRKARDLSINEMAARVGITGGQVSKYLYGVNEPLVTLALKLAAAVGVKAEQVLWEFEPATGEKNLPPMPEGRPWQRGSHEPQISPEQMEVALIWLAAGETKAKIAEALKVSRETFYKALRAEEARAAGEAEGQKTKRKPRSKAE